MTRKLLVFRDLKSGETWTHFNDDWILTYCNFQTPIHPSLLRLGQSVTATDVKGRKVEIKAKRILEAV